MAGSMSPTGGPKTRGDFHGKLPPFEMDDNTGGTPIDGNSQWGMVFYWIYHTMFLETGIESDMLFGNKMGMSQSKLRQNIAGTKKTSTGTQWY